MDYISKTHKALKWIIGVLNRLEIPYQIVGGLAAKCYGSSRPLHDIDIYVPGKTMPKLSEELIDYIEFGPVHHKDENWDLVFLKLKYKGRQIEFGNADTAKYFDTKSNQWVNAKIDFYNSTEIEFEGLKLPVMPREQLIEYKRRLNRTVDQIDLKEL